jgi:hypothetical protein
MQNTGETNYFRVYFKENYTDKPKEHLNHRNPYLTINRDNILLAFPNAETMLQEELSPCKHHVTERFDPRFAGLNPAKKMEF